MAGAFGPLYPLPSDRSSRAFYLILLMERGEKSHEAIDAQRAKQPVPIGASGRGFPPTAGLADPP